jgi:hypothetical protein
MNDRGRGQPDSRIEFLEELVEEHVTIAGDIVEISEKKWAVHGVIPVDGDEILAEFETYEGAVEALRDIANFDAPPS